MSLWTPEKSINSNYKNPPYVTYYYVNMILISGLEKKLDFIFKQIENYTICVFFEF